MEINLADCNAQWAYVSAEQVVRAAHEKFGTSLVMSSHFGRESALLLHLVTQIIPGIPVIYVDEGHSKEFVDELTARFNLNLHIYPTSATAGKLQTLQHALAQEGAAAIFHGIRAYQTERRKGKQLIERGVDGFYRIHPLLRWTPEEVEEYLVRHRLPVPALLPQPITRLDCELQCFPVAG